MKKGFIFCLMGCLWGSSAQADNLRLDRFLLTPEQRQLIDQQRQAYLQQKKSVPLDLVVKKPSDASAKKAKKARPLRLDSIIVQPDGRVTVVINGRWIQAPSAHLQFRVDPNHPEQILLTLGQQVYHLPVGATFDPNRKKIIQPNISIQPQVP